jgi:hypothetical protein
VVNNGPILCARSKSTGDDVCPDFAAVINLFLVAAVERCNQKLPISGQQKLSAKVMPMPLAPRSIVLVGLCLLAACRGLGQSASTGVAVGVSNLQNPARITAAIDERNLVSLSGNVHPLARPEYDRGPAADGQALHRMLLLLQRSPQQETALRQRLEDQQNKASANYHQWLTPEQFGREYGLADADLQAITNWLASHGFSNIQLGPGRMVLELSGNVGQLRNAFHTQLRQYAVKGATYFANASDPQIPAALSPVIAGLVSLNNFPVRSHSRLLGTFQKSRSTGRTTPLFTFQGCSGNCYGVGPADFATIYNTAPLLSGSPKIDGTGQGIAVVGETNINVQDVVAFRTMFGLPQNFSASNIIVNGPDPGINSEETESDLDVQWAGAAAPGARVDLVTSEGTETTSGVHLSVLYIVDHNVDAVMSESYGGCEQGLGSVLNQFYSTLWQQAAAQGITVVVSAGDGGPAGCDDFNNEPVATQGLAVSGFASTPYDVAVGGTDFDQIGREPQFWNSAPTSTSVLPISSSALSYIPEVPWNESCAAEGLTGCANSNLVDIVAGSGGVSALYNKPSWQVGKGVPNDNRRDVPDVSLFASPGFNDSFYIICQSDVGDTPCTLTTAGFTFQGVGGTSASAPAFAGIMAMVNQKQSTAQTPVGRQGNANYSLYALAQQQTTANLSCNSSSAPASGCSFNDVTKGNNAVPCAGASLDCSSHVPGGVGALVSPSAVTIPAFTTTPGYDLATGLGSVNAKNLVTKWASVNSKASTTTLTLDGGTAVNITHGQTVPFSISVTPTSATGDASLVAVLSGSDTRGIGPFTLVSGAVTGSTTLLPGGAAYNVIAHYEGNGTDAPSDSAPVTVTVAPEPSKLLLSIPTFDPTTGQETGTSPTTLVYGSPYIVRADVANAGGTLCVPPNCPTGTVVFTDKVSGVAQGAPNSGTFTLNSSGFTENQPVQFPGGTNIITATYSGDGSFAAPAQPTTYTLVVSPAPSQIELPLASNPALVGQVLTVNTNVIGSVIDGVVPAGTVTFFDGSTALSGPVTYTSYPGNSGPASLAASISTIFTTAGAHSLTAHYNGDPSYAASTSTAYNESIQWPTTTTQTESSTNLIYPQTITVNAKLTTPGKTPPITGQFQFAGLNDPVTGTLSVDANGNQMLTASATYVPTLSGGLSVNYLGDANYASSQSVVLVTVTVPDFSITPNSSALTLSSGQQISETYTFTPLTNYPSTVMVGCNASGIAGLTCAASANSLALANGGSQPLVLTISALGASTPMHAVVTKKRTALFPIAIEWPFYGGCMSAIAALILLLGPRRVRHYGLASALAAAFIVLVFIGCGGGSTSLISTGSSGGGISTPVSTSVTLTLPPKEVFGSQVPFTATVTSTKPLTGQVLFVDANFGTLGYVNVTGPTQTTQISLPLVGYYNITAKYSGDSSNLPSESSAVPLTMTGGGGLALTGTTGPLSHSVPIGITIQ